MPLCPAARRGIFCVLCYEGVRHRRYHRGHANWRAPEHPQGGVRMGLVRYVEPAGVPDSGGPVEERVTFFTKLGTVVEFLAMRAWPDGKVRTPGSITVFFEEGTYKAAVNDKDADVVAFLSARTLSGLLEALEKGLAGNSLDWRRSKWGAGKKRAQKG